MSRHQKLGICGIAIFGTVTCLCFYRMIKTLERVTSCRDLKFKFHVFLLLYTCLETANSVTLLELDGENALGYCFHVLALYCYLLAVMMVLISSPYYIICNCDV